MNLKSLLYVHTFFNVNVTMKHSQVKACWILKNAIRTFPFIAVYFSGQKRNKFLWTSKCLVVINKNSFCVVSCYFRSFQIKLAAKVVQLNRCSLFVLWLHTFKPIDRSYTIGLWTFISAQKKIVVLSLSRLAVKPLNIAFKTPSLSPSQIPKFKFKFLFESLKIKCLFFLPVKS